MKNNNTGGLRTEKTRVKTAKKRKLSSTLWLARQLNDPYVQRAKKEGYRSRAAYKLIELDDRFHFLKPGHSVVDLGAAPGGWTQVAVQRCKGGKVVGIDILPIPPLAGATLLHLDFSHDDAPRKLKEALGGKANVVISDIAPNTTGHTPTDHLRIMALVEMAYEFAKDVLQNGGTFITKVWQGGAEKELLADIKRHFREVKHAKPKASRSDSAEIYLVAMGFKSP